MTDYLHYQRMVVVAASDALGVSLSPYGHVLDNTDWKSLYLRRSDANLHVLRQG